MGNHSDTHELLIKRAYEEQSPEEGYRILVDRVWPRGIKKVTLELDLWAKYIAPSTEVRKAFGHVDALYEKFKTDYTHELDENPQKDEFVSLVKTQLKKQNVTFIYGAKNAKFNQAVVLREYVLKAIK